MKRFMKKKIIIIAIIIAVIIGVLLYLHYTPVWVSISNVIAFLLGCVTGWIAESMFVKFIKSKGDE